MIKVEKLSFIYFSFSTFFSFKHLLTFATPEVPEKNNYSLSILILLRYESFLHFYEILAVFEIYINTLRNPDLKLWGFIAISLLLEDQCCYGCLLTIVASLIIQL